MTELIVRIAAEIDEDSFKAAEKRIRKLNAERSSVITFIKNLFRSQNSELQDRVEALGEITRDMLSRELEQHRRVSGLEDEVEKLKEGE